MNALDSTSTRPYLIRALYDWCTDNSFTPYVAVAVDDTVQVPREYVKDNEIVLNISLDATSSLKLGNEFIEFKARFSGTAREIMVPISHVIAIYARENGQGMAFPLVLSKPAISTESSSEGMGPDASVTSNATESDEGKFMQLVPERKAGSGKKKTITSDSSKPPPRTPPSLKRVK